MISFDLVALIILVFVKVRSLLFFLSVVRVVTHCPFRILRRDWPLFLRDLAFFPLISDLIKFKRNWTINYKEYHWNGKMIYAIIIGFFLVITLMQRESPENESETTFFLQFFPIFLAMELKGGNIANSITIFSYRIIRIFGE